MKRHRYSFELKNDLSELEILSRHLNKFSQDTGLSEACITDINICLDEVFTNIVSYGFKDDEQHMTQFSMQLNDDVLTVSIEDQGIPSLCGFYGNCSLKAAADQFGGFNAADNGIQRTSGRCSCKGFVHRLWRLCGYLPLF